MRVCYVLHLPHDGTKPWDSLPGQGTQGQRDQLPEDAGLYDPLQGEKRVSPSTLHSFGLRSTYRYQMGPFY